MAQQQELTLQQLQAHLQQVKNGSHALNSDLLDGFRLIGLSRLSVEDSQALAIQLYQLLPTLREDPTPINNLLQALLEPWPLDVILRIDPPVDFAAGLDLQARSFHNLTLSLLEKGISDIASARRLAATQPAVFSALLRLWLGTEESGVADKAGHVVYGLLKADRELDGSGLLPSPGDDPTSLSSDNPVWRRVFRDPDVYGVFYSATDLKAQSGLPLSKAQKTIAQARLMELLPKLGALDWSAAVGSHLSEVESLHGLQASQGLLHYAALHMVDYKGDVLMHRSLINFFGELLQICSESYAGSSPTGSPALAFLIDNKLHDRTTKIYLKPQDPSHDPLDITFLYNAAAHYISIYTSTCAAHFLSSPAARKAILTRLDETLNLPPSRWQNSPPPSADLHVLSSVPRELLLPSVNNRNASPLLCIPTRPATADGLNTLATIFHGPIDEVSFPPQPLSQNDKNEAIEARRLYHAYIDQNARMWSELVAAADTIAMKDVAVAAINVITALATATWPATLDSNESDGDTSMTGTGTHSAHHRASTGIETLLSPPALTAVLPYLLKPPQTFSNLVGGRGDAESAAYRVATAKFDAVKIVEKRLLEWISDDSPAVQERKGELERMGRALSERIREGLWGTSGAGSVGGRIATLEL